MSETQNNDFVVETASRIRTRLPGDIVSAYISDTSVINDLTLSVSNVNDIMFENSNKATNATQTYTCSISEDQLYSRCIIKRSTLTIDITGIQTGYNQNVLNMFTVNAPAANIVYDSTNNGYDYKLHRNTHFVSTLPHTYLPGIFGTVCDPLNSSVVTNNLTIGVTASQVDQPIDTPITCDITRNYRTENQAEIYNNFDGVLNPDTYNKKYINQICDLQKTITGTVLDFTTNGIQGFTNGTNSTNWAYSLNSNLLTLDDVNNDVGNVLSVHKRGRVLCPDRATYVFSKNVASVNYEIIGTVITPIAGTTKELYTMIIGNYQFPTNIRNYQVAINLGLPVEMLFFYFNKDVWCAAATAEPANQSLNINIVIKDMESPILNPALDSTYRNVFSNASIALLRFSMHTDIENYIFQSCGKLSTQPLHNYVTQAFISNVVPSSGNISARWSDSSIYLRQYVMDQLLSVQKKQTLIPYVQHNKVWQYDGVLSAPSRAINGDAFSGLNFSSAPIKMSAIGIDVGDAIPKYAQIYIDSELPYEFTSLQVTFNNTKPVILTQLQRLREAAYRNGMNATQKNYAVLSNNEFGFALGGSTSIPRCRDILLLELGNDIPLESLMVPGLTNKSIKMSYTLEVNFNTTVRGIPDILTGDTALNYQVQIIHLTEQEYIIQKNRAENRTALFTSDDVVKSITSIENIILGNKIRSSRAKLQGGNIFSTFAKLRSVVPKILTGVNTAANVASNVASTVGQVADVAKSLTGGNVYGKHMGTAGPVQIPIRQLLGRN